MPNYTEILERLKQARGESFELDVAIAEATAGNMNPVPGYTRSLDAVVALVERVDPYMALNFIEQGIIAVQMMDHRPEHITFELCRHVLMPLFEALKVREIAPSALANGGERS